MSLTTAAMCSGSLTSSSRTSGGSGRRLAMRVVIRIPRPKPVSTICAPSSCARLATAKAIEPSVRTPVMSRRRPSRRGMAVSVPDGRNRRSPTTSTTRASRPRRRRGGSARPSAGSQAKKRTTPNAIVQSASTPRRIASASIGKGVSGTMSVVCEASAISSPATIAGAGVGSPFGVGGACACRGWPTACGLRLRARLPGRSARGAAAGSCRPSPAGPACRRPAPCAWFFLLQAPCARAAIASSNAAMSAALYCRASTGTSALAFLSSSVV